MYIYIHRDLFTEFATFAELFMGYKFSTIICHYWISIKPLYTALLV